ncbi:MAG: helix-turn-helix domain-containing protein [Thermoproteota archaeon]|nr:helix-turn-helix domain-containing protein [Thermoproteota archaeon]
MEQPSFDYPKDSKKGGLLESASKRVRMIFSVMASPNRIDILRILNAKGPLTYSELKALAGFKSKKESGKFAYHLRKLLRQLLVALNKTERRYTITNLGKLVLGLARQIEERSIIESGKMYVRTNKQTIEEFNSHKIIQSLVREANLPLEQAHKITEEVENKIYRFQTTYLTSSLIRETVNCILIEHGHEEYRNKLARLGLPSSDITQMLSQEDPSRNGIERVMTKAAGAIFSEYLLFNTLPKDIADMHLAGEINISNTSVWGLLPDTIFIDLSELEEGLDLKGKFLSMSRIPQIKNSDDAVATLPAMVSLLSREASTEVVLEGFVSKLINNLNDPEHIASGFGRALLASSGAASYAAGMPVITIAVPTDSLDDSQLNALLEGYRRYLNNTPMPRFGLALIGKVRGCIDHITTVVRSGGIISIGNNIVRANNGIKKADVKTTAAMSLHLLSINLPRLAYESNRDETYFRAKLALMIKPSLTAMSLRKKIVVDNIKKGMMPAFASASQLMQLSTTSIAVNLTGTRESVYNILGESSDEILQKVIKTAVEVTKGQGKQLGEESADIAMVSDDSGMRFATLDSEKYGKISLLQSQNTTSYSQGMTLNGRDILNDSRTSIQECLAIDKLLNGGFAASLDLTNLLSDEMKNVIESTIQELPFLRLSIGFAVCTTCGQRSKGGVGLCEFCKSPHKVPLYL